MIVAGDALSTQLAACLGRHVRAGSRLTVGYSGGLDSSVLLYLLADLRRASEFSPGFTLAAVHVHHGLSPRADAWAQHCAEVCRALEVPLAIQRVQVQPAGEGLEAAARAARYRVFCGLDSDFVVLAHHRDDQAETVLLQLLRGASLHGLAAMPEVRRLAGTRGLLRPLLAATRAEILAWAVARGVAWIEDESNADLGLARNALRHAVLPGLNPRFPNAPRVLAQAASQFAEAASLLDALADLDGRDAFSADGLDLSVLHALPEPRARNLLRRFLQQAGVEIHQHVLHEALRQLLAARQDAQIRVDFAAVAGKVVLRRYRHRVVIVPAGSAPERIERVWQGEDCIDLGDAGCLLFRAVIGEGVGLRPGRVSIRSRTGGERLRTAPGRSRRTLKNLLREADIPAWQRASLPLLYLDDILVWAARLGADSDFLVGPGEPGWVISWQAATDKAG